MEAEDKGKLGEPWAVKDFGRGAAIYKQGAHLGSMPILTADIFKVRRDGGLKNTPVLCVSHPAGMLTAAFTDSPILARICDCVNAMAGRDPGDVERMAAAIEKIDSAFSAWYESGGSGKLSTPSFASVLKEAIAEAGGGRLVQAEILVGRRAAET